MKLVSYLSQGRVRSGVIVDDKYIADLNNSCYEFYLERGEDEIFVERFCNALVPSDMLGVIQAHYRL